MTIKLKENEPMTLVNPKAVADICRKILLAEEENDRMKEHIWTIGVDGQNLVKYIELVSLGTLDCSLGHPREIYRLAIIEQVNAIFLIHNHPSGTREPSKEDIKLTERLKDAGKILAIPLLDHIIICGNDYYSFGKEGKL